MIGEKHASYPKEQCSFKANIIHQFPEHHNPFDVVSAATNLDGLVKVLVNGSNSYPQQNGREFQTNEQEMRSFSGINYRNSVNKLSIFKTYWKSRQFIGNEGIRNVMGRSRFEDILRNLHFSDNRKDDKCDKDYKVRFLINHFNQSFSNSV